MALYTTFRPLPTWPYGDTSPRRRAQFRSPGRYQGGYQGAQRIPVERSIGELLDEVRQIQFREHSDEVVIGAGYRPGDIRADGRPRADARAPLHPGVEVSFDSRYGRLTYATDVFDDWRDNLRAIAKGLEALRAVDRWGVAKRGQQYAGFALLSAGPGKEERGRQLVAQYGSVTAALRATHPDTGGDSASEADFDAVMTVKRAEGS